MKSDNNWKETRILSEDIDSLLGLPPKITEDFLRIIENLIVHRFLELLLSDNEEDIPKDYSIELPYLGTLIISLNNKNNISTNFVVRNSFYKKLKKAYKSKSSPLVEQCENILGKLLVKRYEEGEFIDE